MVRPSLPHTRRAPLPLTIVAGAAGAGKTTLLQRLLLTDGARRIALVLAARPSIDSALVDTPVASGLRLRNGNLCLGIDGDVEAGLRRLGETPWEADHVFVEASAGASLRRIDGYAYMPGFVPCGRVAVLDADALARAMRAGDDVTIDSLTAPLDVADLCVVTHVERASRSMRAAVHQLLQTRQARLRVVEADRGGVPAPMLVGIHPVSAPPAAAYDEWASNLNVEYAPHARWLTQPRHEQDYRAWVLKVREPVDEARFRTWAASLPRSIVHGEGVLRLRHELRRDVHFRYFGARWSLTPGASTDRAVAGGWITLIGLPAAAALDERRLPRASGATASAPFESADVLAEH